MTVCPDRGSVSSFIAGAIRCNNYNCSYNILCIGKVDYQ
jgi:hypothetical protein